MTVYEFEATAIDGTPVSLSEYRGKVLLIVNVASRCGFTPQYSGLESLYTQFKDKGFAVLGFPCNQFGSQEPGSESEIQNFCTLNYGVTFPMFSKIAVNGANAHPLYKFLENSKPGVLWTRNIKWNFTKFLIDRLGQPVRRFGPRDKPESLQGDIRQALE